MCVMLYFLDEDYMYSTEDDLYEETEPEEI